MINHNTTPLSMFPVSPEDSSDIEKFFSAKSRDWNDSQLQAATSITMSGKVLALTILRNVPRCADRSAAIRKLRESVSTAIEAVTHEAGAYKVQGSEQ